MATHKCGCIYADRNNTEAVRKGYEMGGYVKQWCKEHAPTPKRAAAMADTKMSEKLWRDCKSDQERADFILCGRAHETGVIATSIQSEVAMAFQRLATLQSLTSINFTLPNHEPTIAIGEILDGYDGDDRDDVWESIKAYADVHARSALKATPPADAALADADIGELLAEADATGFMETMRYPHSSAETIAKLAAALRARPQAVAEGFERVAWQRVSDDGKPLPIFVTLREHLSPVCKYRDVLAASQSATGGAT